MTKLNIAFALTLLLGAVLWNGWVFGWLNHGSAGYLHMSISELEAIAQPHASLFNILEDISGVFLLIGSVGLIALNRPRLRQLVVAILVCTAAIGALTLYDVAHPVDCNRYLNPVCTAEWNAEEVSQTQVLHAIESKITVGVTALLAVMIAWWVYTQKSLGRNRLIISLLTISILATLVVPVNAGDIVLDSLFERLWNVLISVDIAYVALVFLRQKKPSFQANS